MKIEAVYVRLGYLVKERRLELHMTQEYLAKKLKISRPSLANIETGRQRILLHTVFNFEKVLKMPLNELINRSRGRNTA